MKHTKLMAIVTLLVLGISGAFAQSLGDVAKANKKNKTETASASHHYDNDNIPTSDGLSVVGPSTATDAKPADTKAADDSSVKKDKAATDAERQKVADEWKEKLDKQKATIDSLSHELDLDQREMRLRAAAVYTDPAVRGRDAADWDKKDTEYKSEIESKQKAIDEARQKFDEIQEEARKAGVVDKDKDSDSDKK